MKKKLLSLLMASTIGLGLLTGCGSTNSDSAEGSAKIGMVTDSGTIDDKSFNQGSWEGIQRSKDELGTDIKYLKPDGTTIADYSTKIKDLYDGGYKFIVTPGFKFEGAIFEAQDKYKDAKFVLIDGVPNNGKSGDENVSKIGENTVWSAEDPSRPVCRSTNVTNAAGSQRIRSIRRNSVRSAEISLTKMI